MQYSIIILIAGLLFVGDIAVAQDGHEGHAAHSTNETVLLHNLGDHAYDVSTSSDEAQAFFNQGLRLYYAFNHAEAIKAFKKAQDLDPSCAMCYWGEALAWGPNINLPMDAAAGMAAYTALQEALDAAGNAPPKEKALIEALATRYGADPTADREPLDGAYADALKDVLAQYPDDDEIAVLQSEAVMTTMPWDYWDENAEPRPGIGDALDQLTMVLERNPNQPGACHFYIHAVEKHYPEKAVECADRLASLMPGAGHLVHMPGHIYIRVGRYQDAIDANKHAVHADETYIQDRRPGFGVYTIGYYPHNYDFMAFAATMIGDCDLAIEAATKVRDVIPADVVGTPGYEFMQHYVTRPLQMLIRCGEWDAILAYEAPHDSLLHARAMWDYAQGRAQAAAGNPATAREHLTNVTETLHSPELEGVRLEPNLAVDVLAVAETVLAGWIHAAEGSYVEAVAALEKGAELEDQLLYGEPPEWSIPVRQDLGAVLLEADRAEDAAAAYSADLKRFPENSASVEGLAAAGN